MCINPTRRLLHTQRNIISMYNINYITNIWNHVQCNFSWLPKKRIFVMYIQASKLWWVLDLRRFKSMIGKFYLLNWMWKYISFADICIKLRLFLKVWLIKSFKNRFVIKTFFCLIMLFVMTGHWMHFLPFRHTTLYVCW